MRQKQEVEKGFLPSIRSSKSVFQPMLLLSLGLHGLLLAIPIPAEQPLVKQEKKTNNLVTIKPVDLPPAKPPSASPSPRVVQTPLPQRAKVARPNPIIQAAVPRRQSAEVTPPADVPPQQSAEVTSTPSPQPSVSESPPVQATPTPSQTATPTPTPTPTPTSTPSPTPTPTPSPSPIPRPVASPANLGIADINGIPIDASWQPVKQPAQALTEPDSFLRADNQLHPDIVGPIAQVPGNNPDELFENFFQQKLENANFTVEPSGTYVPGGGLYKLTRRDLASPLYLTLSPTKDGTGTVVTIWKNYPQPAT